ncbi:molybdate ABC transporter substrate-binding protein [Chloroflexota bacterium]
MQRMRGALVAEHVSGSVPQGADMPDRRGRKVLVIFLMTLPILIVGSSAGCTPKDKMIRVFTAAGARPAVDEMCQQFEDQNGIRVRASYGGGGEVLSQMILSRSGDVYIAPEQRFMETAVEKEAIKPETVRSVAYMIPAIAVQKDNPKGISVLADLARPGIRVAITRPETTLLGEYAPEIFKKAELAEAIGKNIVTQAARPDSLLTILAIRQVDAVIIWHFYQTLAPDKIEIIMLSPEQLTGIGEMQVAISSYSKDSQSAKRFVDFATSDKGKAVFKKHGYIVEAEEMKKYWH